MGPTHIIKEKLPFTQRHLLIFSDIYLACSGCEKKPFSLPRRWRLTPRWCSSSAGASNRWPGLQTISFSYYQNWRPDIGLNMAPSAGSSLCREKMMSRDNGCEVYDIYNDAARSDTVFFRLQALHVCVLAAKQPAVQAGKATLWASMRCRHFVHTRQKVCKRRYARRKWRGRLCERWRRNAVRCHWMNSHIPHKFNYSSGNTCCYVVLLRIPCMGDRWHFDLLNSGAWFTAHLSLPSPSF